MTQCCELPLLYFNRRAGQMGCFFYHSRPRHSDPFPLNPQDILSENYSKFPRNNMKYSGKHNATWNIPRCITFSPLHSCYIAENRFPFGQCITFMPMRHIFLHLTFSRQRAIKLRTLRQLVQHFCAQVNNLRVKRNGVIYKNRAKKERCSFLSFKCNNNINNFFDTFLCIKNKIFCSIKLQIDSN